jgi:hypothetical protein
MADTYKVGPLANDEGFLNDYARTPWAEILEPHGWVCLRSDSRGEWWEPSGRDTSTTGHTRGAAYTREHGYLYVYTTSTVFEPETGYSKFDAYAILNHHGDMEAAARALYSQGFGVFRERDINGNQIVRCGKYSYTWPADQEPLAVGDTVELPPPRFTRHRELYGDTPWEEKVTGLGSRYNGTLYEAFVS